MKTFERFFLGACLAIVFGAASADEEVATLSQLKGHVLVSEGDQHVRAHEGMKLIKGDRLRVGKGGRAVVTYAGGCNYRVTDDETFTIDSPNVCSLYTEADSEDIDEGGSTGIGEKVATLSQLEGRVLVSKGARYIDAHEGMTLKEGDRLITEDDGRAVITYPDHCKCCNAFPRLGGL